MSSVSSYVVALKWNICNVIYSNILKSEYSRFGNKSGIYTEIFGSNLIMLNKYRTEHIISDYINEII